MDHETRLIQSAAFFAQPTDMIVPLPLVSLVFRFVDEGECRSALLLTGFAGADFRQLSRVWIGSGLNVVLELLHRGTVRTSMLIEALTLLWTSRRLPARRSSDQFWTMEEQASICPRSV